VKKTGEAIGTFTCKICVFSYTRRQSMTEPTQISRIKNFGDKWIHGVMKMIKSGMSYREVARKLGVDTNTVIKYSKKGQLKVGNQKRDLNILDTKKSDYHKVKWLKMQSKFPELTKTQLRAQCPDTYMYLYRHHKEWLNTHSPKKRINKSDNSRVDWNTRDEETLKEVKRAVEMIKTKDGKPIRITVKAIGDLLGKRSLLEKCLDKMPKTKAFIEEQKETSQQFQVRRIQWAVSELYKEGFPLNTWRVVRKAGIRDYQSLIEIDYYIRQFLNMKQ